MKLEFHPIRTVKNEWHEARRFASTGPSWVAAGATGIEALALGTPVGIEIGFGALALESLSRVRRSTHPGKDLAVLTFEFGLPLALTLAGFPQLAVPALMGIVMWEGYQRYRRTGPAK